MKRACALLTLASLAACDGVIEEEIRDASVNVRADGGSVDAGKPDAGTVADAGRPDAGKPDAGAIVDAGKPDAGPIDPCAAVTCAAGSHCIAAPLGCVCNPGFVADGGSCVPGDPGVPALRTQAQVCEGWRRGHVITANPAFTKTPATCDQGILSRAGLDDTLARLNMHRWLVGLGPVSDDPAANDLAQKCALVSAWNPAGQQAHSPAPTSTCYTQGGAQGAGSSNIAWGNGTPEQAIDQWLIDNGNESTMGHRRWLLNPPLDPIGMGHYVGGNNYGSAACITVFSGGNPGPKPEWIAFPPPGFVPVEITQWIWSVHGSIGGGNDAGVVRMRDGMAMPVSVRHMAGGYGQPTLTLERQGWAPQVGETYQVTVTRPTATPITYDVSPVNCP